MFTGDYVLPHRPASTEGLFALALPPYLSSPQPYQATGSNSPSLRCALAGFYRKDGAAH